MTASAIDPEKLAELELRSAINSCRAILSRLKLLSDAATARIDTNHAIATRRGPWKCQECATLNTPRQPDCAHCGHRRPMEATGSATSRHAGKSQIPQGVRLNASSRELREAPSKQFSLWAHYSYRIQQAAEQRDIFKLNMLAACARRDYQFRTGERRPSQHSDHDAAVDELLRDYQGVSSLEAAWMLNQSEKWVRRQRVLNGRDAEQGLELRADETTLRVLRLSAAGVSERMIAAELGLSKSAVHRRIESSMTEASLTS